MLYFAGEVCVLGAPLRCCIYICALSLALLLMNRSDEEALGIYISPIYSYSYDCAASLFYRHLRGGGALSGRCVSMRQAHPLSYAPSSVSQPIYIRSDLMEIGNFFLYSCGLTNFTTF